MTELHSNQHHTEENSFGNPGELAKVEVVPPGEDDHPSYLRTTTTVSYSDVRTTVVSHCGSQPTENNDSTSINFTLEVDIYS